MAYLGSIGSVNVLATMSADLFDESQENPFLLHQQSPSPFKSRVGLSQQTTSFNIGAELPLSDPHMLSDFNYPPSCTDSTFRYSSHSQPTSPLHSSGGTVSFVDSEVKSPGIIKRQSQNSDVSTELPFCEHQQLQQKIDTLVADGELHKLLFSLSQLRLTSGASGLTQDQNLNLLLSREGAPNDESVPEGYYSCDETNRRSSMAMRRRTRKKSACALRQESSKARGFVQFNTVKNLLRGGGAAGRTTTKSAPDAQPTKITGTISSRLKVNQKFVRPAILTDASHRVSDMKLGTKSLKVQAKHIAFSQQWDKDLCDREEADSGMPSPKGQLKNDSFITLETLDKIGTRAACPVHLIDGEKADYTRVSARVDCYNHVRSPKRSLQRPSTWLVGAALDARVAYYEEH